MDFARQQTSQQEFASRAIGDGGAAVAEQNCKNEKLNFGGTDTSKAKLLKTTEFVRALKILVQYRIIDLAPIKDQLSTVKAILQRVRDWSRQKSRRAARRRGLGAKGQ